MIEALSSTALRGEWYPGESGPRLLKPPPPDRIRLYPVQRFEGRLGALEESGGIVGVPGQAALWDEWEEAAPGVLCVYEFSKRSIVSPSGRIYSPTIIGVRAHLQSEAFYGRITLGPIRQVTARPLAKKKRHTARVTWWPCHDGMVVALYQSKNIADRWVDRAAPVLREHADRLAMCPCATLHPPNDTTRPQPWCPLCGTMLETETR